MTYGSGPTTGTGPGRPDGDDPRRNLVIGAGPAGLTAALMLLRAGQRPLALEADGEVGGISRTVERDGWQFDLDGHRLFTRFDEVRDLCHEILTAEADSGGGRAAPTRPGADQGRR